MSAEDFLVVCKKWDWDDLEFADELRSRDKAIVECIKEAIWQYLYPGCIDVGKSRPDSMGNDMMRAIDPVLRELGGNT